MDDKDTKIEELTKSVARRQRWLDRLQGQYAELFAEAEELRRKNADLTRERDSLLGDVTKLNARVAELEAKQPPERQIILP